MFACFVRGYLGVDKIAGNYIMSDLVSFYPQLSKVVKINQFQIDNIKIKLFESVSFTVMLYDINNNFCDCRYFELSTDEYLQWGQDDAYLIKYVKTKLAEESKNL
jgi:hypothetical protein